MKKDNSLPVTLLIIGIVLLFSGGFLSAMGSLAGLGLIVTSIVLFTKNRNKKTYKESSAPREMKIQYIFYIVGVLFIFASVWYFAREFISDLPDIIKMTLLSFSIIISFIIAEFLRGGNK
jgi:membrane-bound ClpP family serine protease|tara:strand:+ start:562 stop:921 length:360 start_codon:yes stop_codon:yes gene_type:complete